MTCSRNSTMKITNIILLYNTEIERFVFVLYCNVIASKKLIA